MYQEQGKKVGAPGIPGKSATAGAPMDSGPDTEMTALSIAQFPELDGLKPGTPVKGTWEGTLDRVENGMAHVRYTSQNIQTENSADREMNRMTGGPKSPMPADDNEEGE